MDIYIKGQNYYYSYQYLKGLSGFSNLKLQYLLDKEKITGVKYKDMWVYKLDDLYKSDIFCNLIQPTVIVIENE
jgi:hypothetical protein